MGNEKECSMKASCCPCGWLAKKVLGLPLCTWVLLFAVLPFTARGVAWSARTVAGIWDGGAKVVGVEKAKVRSSERRDRRSDTSTM